MVDGSGQARRSRLSRLAVVIGPALALAACQGVGSSVRQAATGVGLGAATPTPSEFVTASRGAELDYQPVGVRPQAARETKPRDAAGVKALEDELDEARRRHEALSGKPAAPAPKPAASP